MSELPKVDPNEPRRPEQPPEPPIDPSPTPWDFGGARLGHSKAKESHRIMVELEKRIERAQEALRKIAGYKPESESPFFAIKAIRAMRGIAAAELEPNIERKEE